MDAIRYVLRTLATNERGATAIEYGLIVALIAMGMMAGLTSLGGGVGGRWAQLADEITSAA